MARLLASVLALGLLACDAPAQPVAFPIATTSTPDGATIRDAAATGDDAATTAESIDSSAPPALDAPDAASLDASTSVAAIDSSLVPPTPNPTPDRTRGPSAKKPPRIRESRTSVVNGRLPPEVIRRVIHQHSGRLLLCYQEALRTTPTLEGLMTVSFVIGRKGGTPSTVADGGSDFNDPPLVACVLRVFHAMVFPAPEGGIVTVRYPVIFAFGDE